MDKRWVMAEKRAEDLGRRTDLEAIDELVNVRNMEIVDVGCGDGALARGLAERGANVLGLEPDPVQAAKNREAPQAGGVTLIESGAESIPLDDGMADGVIFARSLHHVPGPLMGKALKEARRVLKRRGFLLVIEPEMRSPFSQLMKPFHDETKVRGAAKRVLKRLVPTVFPRAREVHYTTTMTFPDFETFSERMAGATFNAISHEEVDTPKVREAFERGYSDGGYVFDQRMRVNLFLAD